VEFPFRLAAEKYKKNNKKQTLIRFFPPQNRKNRQIDFWVRGKKQKKQHSVKKILSVPKQNVNINEPAFTLEKLKKN